MPTLLTTITLQSTLHFVLCLYDEHMSHLKLVHIHVLVYMCLYSVYTLHLRVGPSTLTVTFKHRNPNPIEKISCFRTRISEKSAPVPSARVRAMDVLQSSTEAMCIKY